MGEALRRTAQKAPSEFLSLWASHLDGGRCTGLGGAHRGRLLFATVCSGKVAADIASRQQQSFALGVGPGGWAEHSVDWRWR